MLTNRPSYEYWALYILSVIDTPFKQFSKLLIKGIMLILIIFSHLILISVLAYLWKFILTPIQNSS